MRRILVFSSARGGVGRSVLAATASLVLAGAGARAGLLDLDFRGPCAHFLLGAAPGPVPSGFDPPVAAGVRLMSFAFFCGERAAPLRGAQASDALVEMLAATPWGELDWLVIDLPAGCGDELLDALRFLERPEFLVVTTRAVLALRATERLLALLGELQAPVRGLVENLAPGDEAPMNGAASGGAGAGGAGAGPGTDPVRELAGRRGVVHLGRLPFLPGFEQAAGDPAALRDGELGRRVRRILLSIGE